jgi:hypothetical protein
MMENERWFAGLMLVATIIAITPLAWLAQTTDRSRSVVEAGGRCR